MKARLPHPAARLFVALALLATPAPRAQVSVQVPTLVGFKAPIHEQNRLVALVSGKEAKPSLLAGEVQITEFKLETYRYQPDRVPALVVESPGGIFGARGARSDQPISVRSADGRFAIQGQGWSWSQASGFLHISNRVHATLQGPTSRSRTNLASLPTGATRRPPVDIESTSFSYNLRSGAARFRGQCTAAQPDRVRLWAGELAARLAPDGAPPDAITATNDVRIQLLRPGHEGSAAGPSAIYTATDDVETIAIAGPASWEFGPGLGTADALELRPGRNAYAARGHARLRLSRPATAPTAPAAAPTVPLDIACDAIDATEDDVLFHGPVTANQPGVMDLRAGQVTAFLQEIADTGRRAVHRLVATNQVQARVTLATNDVHFQGQRLVYTVGDSERYELDGDPSWTALGSRGTARRFVALPNAGSFEAIDQVDVRWTASDPARTNIPPVAIRADHLQANRDHARLTGHVRAHLDAWNLTSGMLELLLATNAAVREIVASQEAEMKYRMPPPRTSTNAALTRLLPTLFAPDVADAALWTIQAPRMHAFLGGASSDFSRLEADGGVAIRNVALQGRGGRLAYDATDGLLRLTEDPTLFSPDGIDIVGESATTLGLNAVTGELSVDGPVKKFLLPAPRPKPGSAPSALAPGSALQLPSPIPAPNDPDRSPGRRRDRR